MNHPTQPEATSLTPTELAPATTTTRTPSPKPVRALRVRSGLKAGALDAY